ncbi:histidine kinase [Streptosporangium sp. NPDC000563]|uniref:sensor histidine kinase n=1 Tax=Streptosporangium sp. NPDC000563 TaxID=3154366 RepID=UPI0033349672
MPHPAYLVGAVGTGILLVSLGATLVLALRIRRLHAERERALSRAYERFARDMHDIVGHWLWLASIKGELAHRKANGDARLREELEEVLQAVRQAAHAVRNVSEAARRLSFSGEVTRARTLMEGFGAYCSVRVDVDELPELVSTALGAVVREGVTNMLRHSRVKRCAIELVEYDGRLRLTVVNDGAPRQETPSTGAFGTASTGNGVDNLGHRVGELGGTVRAVGGTDGWFTLMAEIPTNFPESYSRLPQKRR